MTDALGKPTKKAALPERRYNVKTNFETASSDQCRSAVSRPRYFNTASVRV